ncbi:hypothetical protein TREES_T100014951 [Tupaia chinensis]|uniref:Uncharacterized protein n=1 Tax=Tupaia chinensis TaxID=246437 RepID=L9KNM8_TUPCH|nr:hypothetical protein TREES_T100014951 [Tupaia chinensis]
MSGERQPDLLLVAVCPDTGPLREAADPPLHRETWRAAACHPGAQPILLTLAPTPALGKKPLPSSPISGRVRSLFQSELLQGLKGSPCCIGLSPSSRTSEYP